MGQVSVEVGGRSYKVACRDGDEPHLEQLARYLNERAQELTRSLGTVGEARLLLMIGLMTADQLFEARGRPSADGGVGEALLGSLADRVDALAETLERHLAAP